MQNKHYWFYKQHGAFKIAATPRWLKTRPGIQGAAACAFSPAAKTSFKNITNYLFGQFSPL
jgi:hypothetical protein